MPPHNGNFSGEAFVESDCNIPLSMGIPAICIGAYAGEGAHTRGEYIEIDSLLPGAKYIYDLVLQHF